MKVLLVTNTISENLKESQFTHMVVSGGDCNIYQGLGSSAMLSWMLTPSFDVIGQL